MNLNTNKIEKEESIENMECYKAAKEYQKEMFEEINQLKAIFIKENN